MKKDFKVHNRVKISRTGGDILDGECGVVIGKSFVNVTDCYIILLDRETPTGDLGITIPEACLDLTTETTFSFVNKPI